MKTVSYRQRYEPVRRWFLSKDSRLFLLRSLYKSVPPMIAAVYFSMAVWLFAVGDKRFAVFVLMPAAVFAAVSFVRRLVDRKRPYEGGDAVVPLIGKAKKGRSFPSRHALSAALIASSCIFINIYIGSVLAVLAAVVAATRVLAGVHYPSDVIAGLVIGYAAGAVTAVMGFI